MDAAALDAARIGFAPGGSVALPAILFLVMLSVALTLRVSDFGGILNAPWRFAGAAAAQLIGLPLVTLVLIHLINPAPSVALGMIIVACCPGGSVSNFFSQLARGDTALSVALTATSSLAAALLTPLSILFWTGLHAPSGLLVDQIALDPVPFLVQTTLMLAAPLALGMGLRARFPDSAARVQPVLSIAALGGIAVMALGGLAANLSALTASALGLFAIAVVHNASAFLTGAAAGRALRLPPAGRRALTIEVGIQNGGLALVIVLSQFDGLGGAAAIAGLWSVWHLVAGLAVAGLFRWREARQAAAAIRAAHAKDVTAGEER